MRARFPWHNGARTRVRIEVTVDESILRPPVNRRVIHEYGEPLNVKVPVYSLEEIVAEKLRALLQQTALLKVRGWSRPRVRDYYDLWRVLGFYGDRMDLADFDLLLREKCAVRDVSFSRPWWVRCVRGWRRWFLQAAHSVVWARVAGSCPGPASPEHS